MFNKSIDEIVSVYDTDLDSWLTSQQVTLQTSKSGLNQITPQKQTSLWIKFFLQFNNPIVYILLVACVLSIFMKEYGDAVVIWIILLVNALMWFIQEYKADQSVKKLITMNKDDIPVIRNGKEVIIDSKYLVPWDIVLFEAGQKVAADIRISECFGLKVDESTLTGESDPTSKDNNIIQKDRVAIWDTHNMLFMGTYVATWNGRGIVVATGMNTELGKIAHIVSSSKDTITPLEKRLHKLGLQIWSIVILVALIVIGIGVYEGHTLYEMFFVGTSLAVSAIPEWLPAVVTLTLAIWVQQLYKQKVLVKQLKSIETLGSTSVICSDKTGTITQNMMTVTDIYINNRLFKITDLNDKNSNALMDQSNLHTLLSCAVHCNNSHLPDIWDPTELALLKIGLEYEVSPTLDKIDEVPFDSDKKYMITHHKDISYLKGAVEEVLPLCDKIDIDSHVSDLDEDTRSKILQSNDQYATRAIRVLWFWYKKPSENTYIFIGMMGMIDPPRPWVTQAIQECRDGGIRVIMITGDNINTAQAIADSIGLEGDAVTGDQFDQAEDKVSMVKQTNIFARVSPIHKVQICEILQSLGHVVAMTGDWVNDAAAIKKADVGISMAITGTDVTKEAADMLLVDDNFVSIVNGVKQWRIIYTNMKKFVQFLLRVNFDEIILILMSIILKLPVPFIAIQVLWINLVTDSLPAVALGFDKWDKDIMQQKPRAKNDDILKWSWGFIIATTLVCSASIIILYFYELKHNTLANMRTVIVTTIIFTELLLAYSIRSDKKNFWQVSTNWYLNGAVLISLAIHLIAINTSIWSYFEFTKLDLRDWVWVLLISWWVFTIFEAVKRIRNIVPHHKSIEVSR